MASQHHQLIGTEVPSDPGKVITRTNSAWQQFISTGSFKKDKPRQLIAQSWQTCYANGLDPETQKASTVLNFEAIKIILEKQDFGRTGREVLDSYTRLMEKSEHVLVLGDAKGRLLYSVGDNHLLDYLEQINFMPGAAWDEGSVGPNGVGTPIKLGRPELILGTEHYCQSWQPLVCYGTPIRSPANRNIIGAIDITGPSKQAQNKSLVLAISIAQTIEQALLIKHLQLQSLQREILESHERRWPNDGLLLLHSDGDLLEMNSRASEMLGIKSPSINIEELAKISPGLWSNLQISMSNNSENEFSILAGNKRYRCSVEVVSIKNNYVGWLLVLHKQNQIPHKTKRQELKLYSFEDIKGKSPSIINVLQTAKIAAMDTMENPVLITGETGTGKELFAQAIHHSSKRCKGPFVAINCGALPAELIESELFGYDAGAFTGARREGCPGKFETAHKGTIFLDELDSLPLPAQVKLLRILEDKTIIRLGSSRVREVDFRLIAASSLSLHKKAKLGGFRLDLYHRLSVLEIELPSLCSRNEDILLLMKTFLKQSCLATGQEIISVNDEVKEKLLSYRWPGNIRELQNLCLRWVATSRNGHITIQDLPGHMLHEADDAIEISTNSIEKITDDLIQRTLMETKENISKAAKKLGIARSTLYRHLRKNNHTPIR